MDQVVCISDDWTWNTNVPPSYFDIPVKGRIYTVVEAIKENDKRFYRLAEIGERWEYRDIYFRPVKKTDIGIFTKMLKMRHLEAA